MSIDWESPGVVRRTMPPAAREVAVAKRCTGSGATSRSSTSIALAVSAAMTARLSARAAREASRDVVTTLPFFRVVAYADASRTTNSGRDLDVDQPADTPRGPNSAEVPRLSQMTLVWTTAPASMVLNG